MARGSSSSASAKAAAKAAQPVRNNDENSRRDEDHEDLLRESAVAEMPQMYRRSLLAMGDPTRARRRMVQRAAQVEPEQNGDPLAPTRSVTIQIGEEPVLVGGNPDLPATAQLVWGSFTETYDEQTQRTEQLLVGTIGQENRALDHAELSAALRGTLAPRGYLIETELARLGATLIVAETTSVAHLLAQAGRNAEKLRQAIVLTYAFLANSEHELLIAGAVLGNETLLKRLPEGASQHSELVQSILRRANAQPYGLPTHVWSKWDVPALCRLISAGQTALSIEEIPQASERDVRAIVRASENDFPALLTRVMIILGESGSESEGNTALQGIGWFFAGVEGAEATKWTAHMIPILSFYSKREYSISGTGQGVSGAPEFIRLYGERIRAMVDSRAKQWSSSTRAQQTPDKRDGENRGPATRTPDKRDGESGGWGDSKRRRGGKDGAYVGTGDRSEKGRGGGYSGGG